MLIVVLKAFLLIAFIEFINFYLFAVLIRVIETIAKSVCSLLSLYKAKKQNCLDMLKKKRTKKSRFKWSSEAMQLTISDIQQSKLSKTKAAA